MNCEFTVTFDADCDYDGLVRFREWLSDRLGEQLFVDHFRNMDIGVYFGPVVELLSFKEDE